MRGITGWGVFLPYRRLDRREIAPVAGGGGGKGRRSVASYDEDVTTMAVEAARRAMAAAPGGIPESVWLSTVAPPYLDKSCASLLHAALGLDRTVPAYDLHGCARSGLAAVRAGSQAPGTSLVAVADMRTGRPGSDDEAAGGDAGAAFLIGEDPLAEIVSWGSSTDEIQDRWRAPGQVHSSRWEERFAVPVYTDLALDAWSAAGADIDDMDTVIVTGLHGRAAATVRKKLGVRDDQGVDDLADQVGNTGSAHPLLLLAATLESAEPGQRIALVSLADGADVVVLRATDALAAHRNPVPVAHQLDSWGPVSYGKFLAWRGELEVEPPNRPAPARPSSSASHRNADWKYGFVASADSTGRVHLPPAPGDEEARPMADAVGTVSTFTVDRLAYSPSPPIVFAVVDFDGGGRLPVELTDVDPDDVDVGARVEMTFRRIFTGEGIHNYFWKARLQR